MKVSKDKYNAIKKATGTADKIASEFRVSCTTVRRIRGSISYDVYKGGMTKKESLTNATASGKKKAGSSSSTTKPQSSDKPESNPKVETKSNNVDKSVTKPTTKPTPEDVIIDKAILNLKKNENSLEVKYHNLLDKYVKKCDELVIERQTSKRFFICWLATLAALVALFVKMILS